MKSPLITAEQLITKPDNDVVVFDCRFSLADTQMGEQQYQQDHISGALYLHLDNDLSSTKAEHGGRHPLPSPEAFEALMRSCGVSETTHVVAYDDQRFAFASRLWWLMRYFGHDNVSILDGGYSAWKAAGGAIESSITHRSGQGNFVSKTHTDWVLGYENIKEQLNSERRTLIDSREAPRYQGLEEPIDPVAGHIPGAVNYPWQEVTGTDGKALSPANLQHRWADLPQDKELVIYCGSGVTACVNLLSLAIIGVENAKLYAGSWSDWCSYPSSPIKKL
ncbi:sulfurtransferase [Porticoccaceae bacterium LTM1]|nr:sulfurtransferase [Porticoccaceae bacterium LTM1]